MSSHKKRRGEDVDQPQRKRSRSHSQSQSFSQDSISSTQSQSQSVHKKRPSEDVDQPQRKQSRSHSQSQSLSQGTISSSQSQSQSIQTVSCGFVERLHLQNFMCHGSLDLALTPKINFIIGRNGSGKSAVLNAILIGLGAQARATNRVSSVKEFIRRGQNSARVEVTLNNQGVEPYKPDVYGRKITVIRNITASGSSTYKVKTISNKLQPLSRLELDNILIHYNIQVDNPVVVLNQEVARDFLNSNNPAKKYEFFIKATLLDQIRKNYYAANEEQIAGKDVLERNKNALEILQKDYQDSKAELKRIENCRQLNDRLENTITKLKNEHMWALVKEKEHAVLDLTEEYNKSNKLLKDLEQEILKLDNAGKNRNEEQQEMEAQITLLKTRIAEVDNEMENMQDENHALKRVEQQLRLTTAEISNKISQRESDRRDLQQEIVKLQKSSPEDWAARKQCREEEMDNIKEHITQKKNIITTREQHSDQLNHAVQQARNELRTLQSQNQGLRQRRMEQERKLADLQQQKNNQLAVFGPKIPELLHAIHEAFARGRFQKKPIGPVGAHVKLRDSTWALAIEVRIGSALKAFCVDNHADSKVLHQLMNSVFRGGHTPPVIISQYLDRVHDVRQHRVQSDQYCSIMDMIIVDNPVVANCLIDQCSVERVLLIESANDAASLLQKRERVPHNCQMAITKCGRTYYPDPNYRTYASRNQKAGLLQVSVEEIIKDLKEVIQDVQQQQHQMDSKLREATQALQFHENEQKTYNKEIIALHQDVKQLTSRIRVLKDQEEPEPVDIASLREEADEIQEELNKFHEEKKKNHDNLEELKVKQNEIKEKMNKIVEERTNIRNEELNPLMEKMKSIVGNMENNRRKIAFIREKQSVSRDKVKDVKKKLEAAEKICEDAVAKAEEVCPRRETRRKACDIESAIVHAQRQLSEEKVTLEEEQKAQSEYEKVHTRYKAVVGEIDKIETHIDMLETMINVRFKQFRHIRQCICFRVKYYFQQFLNARKFKGNIVFDHKNKKLEISVNPSGESARSTVVTSALSGGERSFSTIAFLLALWETIETPFCMLDEFDVFMDDVNRRASTDMLLELAKLRSSRQYTFLTPLSLSDVDLSDSVSVYKFDDNRPTGSHV